MRAALLLLTGCVLRDDLVHVTVRDPSLVAVRGVLPVGVARADIPATAPPYVGDPEPGSWLVREPDAIVAWCPECGRWKRRDIVQHQLDLDGVPRDVLAFSGDQLRIRYTYLDASRCRVGRSGYGYCGYPRLTLDLVTPLANVTALRAESVVSPRNGGSHADELAWGIVWSLGALALCGLGFHDHDHSLCYIAGGMLVPGGFLVTDGLMSVRAHDEPVAIDPSTLRER